MKLTIGQAIRKVRGDMKLKDLAAATGLSITYLSDIQCDKTSPSLKTLMLIADALKVRPGLILDMVTDPGIFDRETFCRNILKIYDAFTPTADNPPMGQSPIADAYPHIVAAVELEKLHKERSK